MRRSWSLLELMVVTIIIGVLAGLAVPQYNKMIIKSKLSRAKHAMSMIAQAQRLYESEEHVFTAFVSYGSPFTVLSNVTGIDLTSILSDDYFEYRWSDTTDGVWSRNKVRVGDCVPGTNYGFNSYILATGAWTWDTNNTGCYGIEP